MLAAITGLGALLQEEEVVEVRFFWDIAGPLIGVIVFIGSIWLVTSTDIGRSLSFLIVLGGTAGFVFITSLMWFMYSTAGPKIPPDEAGRFHVPLVGEVDSFWQGRFYAVAIGIGSLVIMIVCVVLLEAIERSREKEPETV